MQGFVRTADRWPCQRLCRQQFLCRPPGSPLTSVLPWKATSHISLFLPATSWGPGQACVECAYVCLWLGGEGALWDADLREDFFLRPPRTPPAPPHPVPSLCSVAGPCEPTILSLTRPLGLPTQTCLGLRGTPGLVGCSAVAGLRFLMIFEQGASHFYFVPDPDNVALNAVTQAPCLPRVSPSDLLSLWHFDFFHCFLGWSLAP